MKKIAPVLGFLCIFFFTSQSIGQDSLADKDYSYLQEKLIPVLRKDTLKANIYLKAYLQKALKANDSLRITEAYRLLSFCNGFEKSILYIEEGLKYNHHNRLKNDRHFHLLFRKGFLNYSKNKYVNALDSYLKAKTYIMPETPPFMVSAVEYNLAVLRFRVGDIQGAKTLFKKNYESLSKQVLNRLWIETYLKNLNSLSLSYWLEKKIDSAIFYNDIYLKESEKYKILNDAKVTQAIFQYEKGNVKDALDSIVKYTSAIEKLDDNADLAITYFYTGKIYKDLNQWETAISHFKKVDTLMQKYPVYIREIEENYEILYKYYEKQGDTKNHIYYLEKLINFDSILYTNNTYLKNTLLTKYDIPKLIDEKEILIKQISNKERRNLRGVYILSGMVILLLIWGAYHYRKKVIYKKRFEKLIKENTSVLRSLPKTEKKQKQKLSVPEGIVAEVLKKMESFEDKKQFLDNKTTLNTLAKRLGTNTSYLSKIINYHKGKNFSAYLSDLRIDYVIQALKEDAKLRGYTIKAIAFEVGFKNSESFTNAFYKQTGIYPSYFIKQLEKQ